MYIDQEFRRQGAFLYRWRRHTPLLLFIPGIAAVVERINLERRFLGAYDDHWLLICLATSTLGLALRWITIGYARTPETCGSAGGSNANPGIFDGMYSIVRHPLHLANFFVLLGILSATGVWWFVGIGALSYWLYAERLIVVEEDWRCTRNPGVEYRDWEANTPLFVPDFSRWRKPELTFSFRKVFRREYSGIMLVVSTFFVLEMVVDLFIEKESLAHWLAHDWIWVLGLVFCWRACAIMRTMKRHTSVLDIQTDAITCTR